MNTFLTVERNRVNVLGTSVYSIHYGNNTVLISLNAKLRVTDHRILKVVSQVTFMGVVNTSNHGFSQP